MAVWSLALPGRFVLNGGFPTEVFYVYFIQVFFPPWCVVDACRFCRRLYAPDVLLAFAAVYLGWSVWTANKSSGYEHPRECFADILGDIFTYSLLLAGLCVWLLAPKHLPLVQTLPPNHYWILTAFLGAMIGVTFIEMLITVHTCLIAMWRQNPITLTR